MSSKDKSVIIFFDGICHLCNGFVDFMIQKDSQKKLHFAPLQGATAKELLEDKYRDNLSSVLVKTPTQILEKSDAVIFALNELGGIYSFAKVLKIIPRFLRDAAYSYIAKNRYNWFGERDICRLPLPEEKAQLLP